MSKEHKVQAVVSKEGCAPDVPPPTTQEEPCEGDITLSGKVVLDCCCPCIRTRTFILNIGPQSEGSLITFLQNTVNAYEGSGYMVLGHSVVDAGAGWIFGLTIGWYA